MKVSNQIKGRINRANGEYFENWITSACDFYWQQGYACIEKTPEPMRPLKPYGDRKNGQFIACYKKQAQPDYKGALCDGSCIIFDAKHTDKDKILQSVITTTQAETFDKYEKMGAKCYVIVSIGFQKFYRVPWSVWKTMKERYGHKYMSEDNELEPFRVPYTGFIVRFLEGVELK